MDVSNQMLEVAANAKTRAKSAEEQFDFAAKMVNIKSGSNINLFSGRAVSQVADIASSVRKACDELYASYQSLVLMLDQQCRPLLSLNPSTHAVKEVMEIIKWLNKESEIGSNFSGSLNGASLGDLIHVNYFASMECQMIQKHWENVYSTMPDTEEENRAFNQRQTEERIAARKAEREARDREREWERQERERERQEREDELQQRLKSNAVHADATAKRREYLKPAQGMFAESLHSYAFVKPDGTVDVVQNFSTSSNGTPGDVSRFKNIKAVVCTDDGIVGLRNNGTCIATNPGASCDAHIWEVSQWRDIQALAAGDHHVVGLRSDGTCVATSIKWNVGYGYDGQSEVSGWSDIVAIACGMSFTMGLKRDGTIVYTGASDASAAQLWKDIALIAAYERGAVGVTQAGEVVGAGKVNIGSMERAENIVQLGVSGGCKAYALQADGTLVGGRQDSYEPSKKVVVADHILAIASGNSLLALKEDGSIQSYGRNYVPLKVPSGYRLFDSYDAYMKERLAAEEAQKQKERQQKAYRDAGVCQYCGGAFKKSLFGCKCSQCGKRKDY